VALVEGYFDESGDFEVPPYVFCVAGYFLASERAKLMDEEWGEVLQQHRIPYFHMVDCAHGNGIFSKPMEVEERIEIVRKLIAIIKRYVIMGFSFLARKELFEITEKNSDPYTACTQIAVFAIKAYLEMHRIDRDIACFFEAGHKNKGRAYRNIADNLTDLSASVSFGKKEEIRLLQAADLLAWQSTKYAKDGLNKKSIRKDFASLLEHPHSLMFLDIRDNQLVMLNEEWPISRRSTSGAMLIMDKNTSFLAFPNGDVLPVALVDKATGWIEAAGYSCIGLKQIGKRPEFTLAFNEVQLYEAICCFLAAMEVYKNTTGGPLVKANGLQLDIRENDLVLRVQLPSGKFINFSFEGEAASQLRDKFKL
jgi:hypothetical protein